MYEYCKCDECGKKDTQDCIRLVESVHHSQAETMLHIEIECLKTTIKNQWNYIEEILSLISSRHFKDEMIMEEVRKRKAGNEAEKEKEQIDEEKDEDETK